MKFKTSILLVFLLLGLAFNVFSNNQGFLFRETDLTINRITNQLIVEQLNSESEKFKVSDSTKGNYYNVLYLSEPNIRIVLNKSTTKIEYFSIIDNEVEKIAVFQNFPTWFYPNNAVLINKNGVISTYNESFQLIWQLNSEYCLGRYIGKDLVVEKQCSYISVIDDSTVFLDTVSFNYIQENFNVFKDSVPLNFSEIQDENSFTPLVFHLSNPQLKKELKKTFKKDEFSNANIKLICPRKNDFVCMLRKSDETYSYKIYFRISKLDFSVNIIATAMYIQEKVYSIDELEQGVISW